MKLRNLAFFSPIIFLALLINPKTFSVTQDTVLSRVRTHVNDCQTLIDKCANVVCNTDVLSGKIQVLGFDSELLHQGLNVLNAVRKELHLVKGRQTSLLEKETHLLKRIDALSEQLETTSFENESYIDLSTMQATARHELAKVIRDLANDRNTLNQLTPVQDQIRSLHNALEAAKTYVEYVRSLVKKPMLEIKRSLEQDIQNPDKSLLAWRALLEILRDSKFQNNSPVFAELGRKNFGEKGNGREHWAVYELFIQDSRVSLRNRFYETLDGAFEREVNTQPKDFRDFSDRIISLDIDPRQSVKEFVSLSLILKTQNISGFKLADNFEVDLQK